MSKSSFWLTFFTLVLAAIFPSQAPAQAPPSTAVEGATLIDGNGGAPLRDSVIVMTGNKITAVGRKADVKVPAGAQVINADGKFIIPGLIDSHGYGTWYINDMYINHGVTATVDNGLGGELSIVHREAVNHAKIAGPRYITSIGYFSTDRTFLTGYEPKLFHDRVPKTPDEARDLVRGFVAAKADFIFFADGKLPTEINAAIIDESKKAHIPIILEAVGPNLTLDNAIDYRVDQLTHSGGVSEAIAKDPSKWNNELDRYADMDDAKAQALVKRMAPTKITLTPNFLNTAPGMPKAWARFQEENRQLFSNPDILAYFPDFTNIEHIRITALGIMHSPEAPPLDPVVFERRHRGYLNMMKFHKMYLDAGGRVTAGGNTNVSKAVGLDLHQELEVFVEGGFTPMEAIQSATKWPAETFHWQDRVGTIEAGKYADMLILNGDPLQDIHNTQNIDNIVFNGKIIDRKYHPWPSDPFMDMGNYSWGNPPVESLNWVVALKNLVRPGGLGGGGREEGVPNPVVSPQPAIATISPTLVTEGDPTTTLAIKGMGFVRRMQVYYDGRSVPYKIVSPEEVDVTLDSMLLRTPGKYDIQIKNPQPIDTPYMGDGSSNLAHLLVNFRY